MERVYEAVVRLEWVHRLYFVAKHRGADSVRNMYLRASYLIHQSSSELIRIEAPVLRLAHAIHRASCDEPRHLIQVYYVMMTLAVSHACEEVANGSQACRMYACRVYASISIKSAWRYWRDYAGNRRLEYNISGTSVKL